MDKSFFKGGKGSYCKATCLAEGGLLHPDRSRSTSPALFPLVNKPRFLGAAVSSATTSLSSSSAGGAAAAVTAAAAGAGAAATGATGDHRATSSSENSARLCQGGTTDLNLKIGLLRPVFFLNAVRP